VGGLKDEKFNWNFQRAEVGCLTKEPLCGGGMALHGTTHSASF